MATLHLAAGDVADKNGLIFIGMNEVQPNPQACDGAARAHDCAQMVSGSRPRHEQIRHCVC